MTEKNIPLLMATMAMIKTYPEKHDQGSWVDPCNTTMCFAGHAAMIAGATFDRKIFEDEDAWAVDPEGKHVPEIESYEDDGFYYRKEGYGYVDQFATKKLGLDRDEAGYLFHHSRTREQLENAVSKFAEGYSCTYYGEFYKKEG